MRIKDIVKSKKNYAFYTSEDYGHDFPRLYTGVFVPDYCTAGIPAGVTSSFYGPPGSNKCLKQDALVFSDKGIVEIGSFKDGRDKGFTDLSETFSGPDGKPVPSSQYYIDETEDIVYIKNSLGLELEGTPSHKIRVLNKDAEFEMKKLADIEEGDIACICRDNSVFSKENVELPKYSRDFHSNANEADLPNKCTPELARLFGYLIANGFNSGKSALGISTKNKNIKQDIDVICGNLGLNVGKHLKGGTFTVGGIKFKDIVFSCLEVKKFPTARFKKIPNIILKSNKEIQLSFLQALFDCDAHLEKRGRIIYSSASEVLAKQVQILLLSRGFISSRHPQYLKKYDHTYWSVVLTVGDTHEFLKKVNSIKYCGYDKEFSSRTNVDLIHNLKDVLITKVKDIKELFKVNAAGTYYHNDLFLRFTVGHVCHSHIDRAVTYPWLQNVIEQLENTPQIPEVVELIEFCKVFIDKNYFYSPIVKVA